MPNILFFIFPEKGHLNSSLKIAKTLKARGHTVIYSQVFEFEEYVRNEGLEFTPLFGELFPKSCPIHQDYSLSLYEQLSRLISQFAASRQRTMSDLLKEEMSKILATVQPELLVMDAYLAKSLVPAMPPGSPQCMLLNSTIIDPYDETTFSYVSGMTTLFLCPEEFNLPHTQKLPQYRYVEASCDVHRKEKPGFPWDRIDDSKKLIYCALGSQSHWSHEGADLESKQQNIKKFLQAVNSALCNRTDYQLVMAMGIYLRAEDFHSVPTNAVLVNEAPQMAVLKKAWLAITHGGLNSVKECIFFGVPMMVFPVMGDQLGNAARVAFHRIGVAANIKTATAESISALLAKMESDPGLRQRAATMMETFQKAEREQRAVTLIEQCLAGNLPVPHVVEREARQATSTPRSTRLVFKGGVRQLRDTRSRQIEARSSQKL